MAESEANVLKRCDSWWGKDGL